jgi:archaellum component FlaC
MAKITNQIGKRKDDEAAETMRALEDAHREIERLRAEVARLKASGSNILSVVNCDLNSRRNLG